MSYAIITVGGKQYRVREGERLLVDRLAVEDGKTFTPNVLLVGGDGEPQLRSPGRGRHARGASGSSEARRSASASTRSAPATSGTPASGPR